MDHLHKLLEKKMKKDGGQMDEKHKAAKMAALKELHDEMKNELGKGLGDHLEGLKKVTVAAPDKGHLKEGLEAAKHMVSGMPEGNDEEDESNEQEQESSEMTPPEEENEATISEMPQGMHRHMQQEEEHAANEENEIADLKKQIEELKQLILSR